MCSTDAFLNSPKKIWIDQNCSYIEKEKYLDQAVFYKNMHTAQGENG